MPGSDDARVNVTKAVLKMVSDAGYEFESLSLGDIVVPRPIAEDFLSQLRDCLKSNLGDRDLFCAVVREVGLSVFTARLKINGRVMIEFQRVI